ncbi:Ankyrin repeat and SOCS box protein 3 [Toxocara canis]|uniref:Ankyrin repeat and SOCS box protein 3 n=1 Tax=Toxocara canis TaxID=6265 RepID=A0A0B2W5T5_TOXCA|nr:Ankyrin repeat and SOCS box protein 3 [Toxocara canis]
MDSDGESATSEDTASGDGANRRTKRKRSYQRPVPFLYSEGDDKDVVLEKNIEAKLKSKEWEQAQNELDYNRVAHTVTVGVACRLGHIELTRQLLLAGHGGFPDDRRWWPIHEAAYGLHFECCQLLIEIGHADVNARAHDGVTPLLLVCRRDGDFEKAFRIAKLLIENGADPNLCSLDEMTPLIQAIKSRNRQLIDLLLDSGADAHKKWYNQWTALHEAANSHDEGADPNLCSLDEMTPLIQAIKSRNRQLIDLLLDSGADAHKKWYNQWTALHEAANSHDEVTMKRLLDMGEDVFAVDDDGHSVLFVAVQEGYMPCVELVLAAAKDRAAELANKRLPDGCSCVMVAVTEGLWQILSKLVEHGADCNLTIQPVWGASGGGLHALAVAAQHNYWKCVEILLPHVDRQLLATTDLDPMSAAAFRGSVGSISRLLEAGYSTEVRTDAPITTVIIPYLQPIFQRAYYTPLREAVRKDHVDVVQMLIAAGAKMMYESECYSPFLFSFRNRLNPEIMRCFLENDVDLDIRSKGTLSNVPDALLAVLGTENRKKLLVLLKCGLKPNLQYWCACCNPTGYSLIRDVSQSAYVQDFKQLMKLISVFSPYIPSCCSEVADAADCKPQIGSLAHLCRLSLRSCFRRSQLLDERWLNFLPNVPRSIKRYLAFDPLPFKFDCSV